MNASKSRKIKVFISSTFRDMHQERDYLNDYVFPRIHNYCKERFIDFYPIDLRWGITEQDSKNGLVMTACLEAIDDSCPFFIAILGSRYGWIPTEKEAVALRVSVEKQKPWVLSKIEEHASITEIEIEYGALKNSETAHACFFLRNEKVQVPTDFKENTGSVEEIKLKQLKKKIVEQKRFPVHQYSSVSEFGDKVYDELMKLIKEEYPESGNDYGDYIIDRHEYALTRRSKIFCDLSALDEYIDKWLNGRSTTILINGPNGYGSSTSLARAVCYIRDNYEVDVHYYDFEEADLLGNKVTGLIHFMSLMKRSYDTEIIAIDNCSLLTQTECTYLVKWLFENHTTTKVMFSAANASPADIIFRYCLSPYLVYVHGYFNEQRRDYINNYLNNYSKKLTPAQVEMVYNMPIAKDPTYLSFILNDLLNFGLYEELDEYLKKIVDKSYLDDSLSMFSEIKKQGEVVAAANCFDEFTKAMVLLAQLQDVGISENDLCSITGILSAKWAIIRPFVIKWCKGNKSKLVFIKLGWSHGIKLIWDTPLQAAIGVKAIEWFLDNKELDVAVPTIVSIWMYIWHLPIDEGIGGKEKHIALKQKLHDLSCSPDVVLQLDSQRLCSLLRYLMGEFPIGAPKRFYGRNYSQLSYDETEEYYLRLAQVATSLNCGSDAAYCYAQLSFIAGKEGNNEMSTCYRALSSLSIGKAYDAIDIVKEQLPANKSFFSIFKPISHPSKSNAWIHVMALCISCQASTLAADVSEALNKIVSLDEYMKSNSGYFQEQNWVITMYLKTLIDVLYLLCYTKNYGRAIELYNSLSEYKEMLWYMTSPDCCAKYLLSASIIWLYYAKNKKDCDRHQENENCYKYAVDAMEVAWLSGQDYLQNQAKIIADYIYYDVRGEFRDTRFQIYKNAYNPPATYSRIAKGFSNRYFDWSKADETVKRSLKVERNFYDNWIADLNNIIQSRMKG